MAKMTEDQKAARKNKLEETRRAEEEARLQKADAWIKEYPNRVKEYRSLIKQAKLKEIVLVNDDLSIEVAVENTDGDNRVVVGNERFYYEEEFLNQETPEWVYDSMVSSLQSIIKAQKEWEDYLIEVRNFKHSLTDKQLAMIKDFNRVF